jgi:hypothetical protein
MTHPLASDFLTGFVQIGLALMAAMALLGAILVLISVIVWPSRKGSAQRGFDVVEPRRARQEPDPSPGT